MAMTTTTTTTNANSCNCDWMYFDYQFSETVYSFDLYAFACGCSDDVLYSCWYIFSNASFAPLNIVCMQTDWMTKSRMVMNGNGYRLARIAKCIRMKWKSNSQYTLLWKYSCVCAMLHKMKWSKADTKLNVYWYAAFMSVHNIAWKKEDEKVRKKVVTSMRKYYTPK